METVNATSNIRLTGPEILVGIKIHRRTKKSPHATLCVLTVTSSAPAARARGGRRGCPSCKEPLGEIECLLATTVLENVKHECDLKGCKENILLIDYKKHQEGWGWGHLRGDDCFQPGRGPCQ